MSDPYIEVSRQQKGHGFSPLAWFGIFLAGFFVVGIAGTVGMGLYVAKKAQHFVQDFRERPVEVFADLADAFDDIEVVHRDEASGVVTLRMGDDEELVTVDLADVAQGVKQGFGSERIAFRGSANDQGGVLKIQTDEGETRIELRGGEEGGFLRIETPDDELHFGAGEEAASVPSWIPIHPGASVEKRIFSGSTAEGDFGAFMLRTDSDPSDVMAWYTEAFADAADSGSLSTRFSVSGEEHKAEVEWVTSDGDERELTVVTGRNDEGESFVLVFHRNER